MLTMLGYMSKDIEINISYIQRHENLLLREPKFEKSQIWKKPGKQPAFFKTAGFYWLFSNFWLFCQPWMRKINRKRRDEDDKEDGYGDDDGDNDDDDTT